ncbi:cytosine deaminase [Oricola sp.]|uniref:cytosine deaminase n=1 Tax=Oricola sp. TaxID=1979950 RepID=UPI0025D45A56|nr:cytosine deaminase [Oricola sp.]MCI5078136.1 cytosine deaminase [Oricola sp.]
MTAMQTLQPSASFPSDQAQLRKAVAAASQGSFTLRNVRLHDSVTYPPLGVDAPDDFALADVRICDRRIETISPAGATEAGAETASIDAGRRVMIPNFVDCHTHIDKAQILGRAEPADGTFAGAAASMRKDREAHWTAEDVHARMDFALRSAFHHGTRALRTHIDSHPPQDGISWPVLARIRQEWQGRIEIQGSSLFPVQMVRDRDFLDRVVTHVKAADGVLGAAVYPDPEIDHCLDVIIQTADRHGLDLDFHADETADPASDVLRHVADAVLRNGYQGNVLVGHCCSLAVQDEATADETLDAVAAAGLAIVSLPACNLYLQDRRTDGTTPRWRGVTLLHEMRRRGISVSLASDNTRDSFHAYGDLDMLDAFRLGTRIAHLDHPSGDWIASVTTDPARAMGMDQTGTLKAGCGADFILFEGRSWSEILSRSESDRIVVRDGAPLDTTLPAYAELDGLAHA